MKNHFRTILTLILACLNMAACINSTQTALPTPSNECQTPIEWKIELSRSGGIAGQARSVKVSSNGYMITKDLQSEDGAETKLSQDELKKISGILVEACPFEIGRISSGCADCFVYKLVIFMNGKRYSLEANELNIPEKSKSLIEYLESYLTN